MDTIPNLRRKRVKVSERDTDVPRRVVHEDVDPAEMTHHLLKTEIDRFGVSLIELHGVALPASTSHRRHHRIGTTNLADVGNGDIRAGGRKSLRNCSPNVAGTSGHERNFSIEIHGAPFESRQASTVNDESISLSSKAANANIQVRNASPRVPRRHGATLHGGGLACDGRA